MGVEYLYAQTGHVLQNVSSEQQEETPLHAIDTDDEDNEGFHVSIPEVYHLQEISGNSGWDVNGTRLFGSFHWKIPGKNGQPEKVVPFSQWKFSRWKCVFHLQISRLSDQCQSFHGLFSNQAFLVALRLKWRGKFL